MRRLSQSCLDLTCFFRVTLDSKANIVHLYGDFATFYLAAFANTGVHEFGSTNFRKVACVETICKSHLGHNFTWITALRNTITRWFPYN